MNVVTIEVIDSGIVLIRMQDVENKNMFTSALIEGLIDAFDQVKKMINSKVIILTGYDNYFATGATQQTLLELNATSTRFNAVSLYRLTLDAEVPVIAAMQGHGIGGGFVMGVFADIVLLSRESIYTTNFMKYGFTPGMGATYIIPYKIGTSLGNEMLLTARNYRGEELKQRGVPFQVFERERLLDEAIKIAKELNNMPKKANVLLKQHLNKDIYANLDKVIQSEVAMHEKTIHHNDVKSSVMHHFSKLNNA